jgi:hypothetical protein
MGTVDAVKVDVEIEAGFEDFDDTASVDTQFLVEEAARMTARRDLCLRDPTLSTFEIGSEVITTC